MKNEKHDKKLQKRLQIQEASGPNMAKSIVIEVSRENGKTFLRESGSRTSLKEYRKQYNKKIRRTKDEIKNGRMFAKAKRSAIWDAS